MKDKELIIEFIKERLLAKGIEVGDVQVLVEEEDFYRFHVIEEKTGIGYFISMLLSENESERKWYEGFVFDGDMDESDREREEKENPIEKIIPECFPQLFQIGELKTVRLNIFKFTRIENKENINTNNYNKVGRFQVKNIS